LHAYTWHAQYALSTTVFRETSADLLFRKPSTHVWAAPTISASSNTSATS
jgi:hypothetical protein